MSTPDSKPGVPQYKHGQPLSFKKGKTSVEILDLCIDDINNNLWVCGTLIEWAKLNGFKKPMGCAMGLVGVNSGSLKTVICVIPEGQHHAKKPNGGELYNESGAWGGVVEEAEPRDKTKNGWTNAAIDSLKYLALTGSTEEHIGEVLKAWNTRSPIKHLSVDTARSIVVHTNDSCLKDEKEAVAWFTRARDLAKGGMTFDKIKAGRQAAKKVYYMEYGDMGDDE